MASTVHSSINNRAGAKVEVRNDTGNTSNFYWACTGCKTTDSSKNPTWLAQKFASEHAERCNFN